MHISTTLAYALVGIAAIVFGVWLARRTARDAGWFLRRGTCPGCKARKSLRENPVSATSLLFDCAACAEVWLVETPGGQPIITQPEPPKKAIPSLSMYWNRAKPCLTFSTKDGSVEYDFARIPTRLVQNGATPREAISQLDREGIVPSREEYADTLDALASSRYTAWIESLGLENQRTD